MATETQPRPRRETDGTASEPADYAALNAAYALLMGSLLITTRERARRDPVQGRELVPIAAATFALSKVVAREKIGSWLRDPFVEVENGQRRPRGTRLRGAVGELLTCTRCVGAWSALALVGLRVAEPTTGRTVVSVLAASAGNDWLQAAFKWTTAQTNRAEQAQG